MVQRAIFTLGAAQRIADAVLTVERGNRDEAPLTFTSLPREPRPGAGLRLVEWSDTWPAAGTAVFTFSPSNATATGVNVFAGVDAGSGWVARHSGTWHLVTVNLTTQPDYASGDIQMLGHDDEGILRWYTIIECGGA